MKSFITAGFRAIRNIGNPYTSTASSLVKPSERCMRFISYAKKPTAVVYGCTETPDCGCKECMDRVYEREEACMDPLLTQRQHTLANMTFSDFNDLRKRDVIRVKRNSYCGEYDTLVVLNNGKLLQVSNAIKSNRLVAYDTIFQYLHDLTINQSGFYSISLNEKTSDPNYPSLD